MKQKNLPAAVNPKVNRRDETADMGPAMRELSPQQRSFVHEWFNLGGRHGAATEAALAAGYSDNGARQQAYRLLNSEKIKAAMLEEARRRHSELLPLILNKTRQIIEDDGHKDQFRAIQHAAAIAGVSPVHQVEHRHVIDRAEATAQLQAALAVLAGAGVDLAKVIDGTAKDITPASATDISEAEAVGNSDGAGVPDEEDWTAV